MVDPRISSKVKKAAQLLFFRSHYRPGIKEWELKKALGRDYEKIIEILNEELDKLGMEVKAIDGEENARYLITLKDAKIEKASGWRVDDVAMLAASIAYIVSRQGKASKNEIEQILKDKFPNWRIITTLDRFIRQGYLGEDGEILYIGWRTRAEVDRKTLLESILSE